VHCVHLCRCITPAGGGEHERGDVAAELGRVVPSAQETEAIHALPDDDPRTGVRRQLVHNATEALGDRVPTSPDRATGQSLVPEPANEAQEAERESQTNDIP